MNEKSSNTLESGRRGFTLIELLVVIAIIGLLSSVVLASLSSARSRAYDTQLVQNLRSIERAIESFASDHNRYPNPGTTALRSECTNWGGLSAESVIYDATLSRGIVPDYLQALPRDSRTNDTNIHCILYRSDGKDYKLFALNITSTDVFSQPSLMDPRRNNGAGPNPCVAPDPLPTAAVAWAIWSGPNSRCW